MATAKRELAPGDMLDGEGGCMAWGKQLPATIGKQMEALFAQPQRQAA